MSNSNFTEKRLNLRTGVNTGLRINFAGEIKTSRNTKRLIKKSDLDKREQVPTRRSQRLRNLDEEQRRNSVKIFKNIPWNTTVNYIKTFK